MLVFIDESIFEKQHFGGISRYFCKLVTELSNLPGIQVVVYSGRSSNAYLDSIKETRTLKIVRLSYRNKYLKHFDKLINGCCRKFVFLRAWLGSETIIYHPSYFSLDGFIRKLSNATVLTVHDLIYETLEKDPKQRKIEKRRRLQNIVDHILTVSESTAKDLIRFNPSVRGKITVTLLAASFPEEMEWSGHEVLPEQFFMFVGRRTAYKQGLLALEAFQKTVRASEEDLHFLYVGGGKFTEAEEEKINFMGLSESVSQIDLSDQGLRAAYQRAIALVFPSDYEGFGLPVLEAIHFECPVIAQRVSSIPEVGGDWPFYISVPDIRDLSETMHSVLQEGREHISLRKSDARQECIRKFSWRKTAMITSSAYLKAIEQRGL